MKINNFNGPFSFNPSFVLHQCKNKCCWEYQAAPGKGSDENEKQQRCTDTHKLKVDQTTQKIYLKIIVACYLQQLGY